MLGLPYIQISGVVPKLLSGFTSFGLTKWLNTSTCTWEPVHVKVNTKKNREKFLIFISLAIYQFSLHRLDLFNDVLERSVLP